MGIPRTYQATVYFTFLQHLTSREQYYKPKILVSKHNNEKVLNLMLITEDEKKHVLMKHFNRMMFSKTKQQHRKNFCMHCLQCFGTKEILIKNTPVCMVINGEQSIRMLKKGSTVQFKNFHKQLTEPFVIYADFEAITEKVDSCQPDSTKSYTEKCSSRRSASLRR